MSTPEPRPVLARIIAAHRGAGPGEVTLSPALKTGMTRALRRAAVPFEGLMPEVGTIAVALNTTLTAAVAALPDTGLVAALEDEEGRRGLFAIDHRLLDALIEVQATGRVEEAELPPRRVTRIDEALCRDFLDLVLASFARETADVAGRDWPDRMTYGSLIVDRGQLNLLLPEKAYHRLEVPVTAAGRRQGKIMLLLPVDPALARERAAASLEAQDRPPLDWSDKMLIALGAAPMDLDAVLVRVTMPLGQVRAMEVGDLIPFKQSDLASVTLEGEANHVFARGTLGQADGMRAVRLGGGGAAARSSRGAGAGGAAPVGALAAAPSPEPTQLAGPASGAPTGASEENLALAVTQAAGFDSNAPMGDFDPNAPMGGFDPDAPMGGFDPDAPMGGFDPDAPMGGFDPNAPIG